MRPLLSSLIGCLIMILPLTASALTQDTDKTMHINAGSTLFDYKNGLDTYQGDVTVTQGSTRLAADKLTTQKNSSHKLAEVIAYGYAHPANYWSVPKPGDKEFHAQAQVIKFYPIKSLVMLEGNVVVTQGENSFRGPIIIYNIKNQIVSSPASPKGRSTIVIEPKQLQ
jgi:lipopolysaccharide export system protein LptA